VSRQCTDTSDWLQVKVHFAHTHTHTHTHTRFMTLVIFSRKTRASWAGIRRNIHLSWSSVTLVCFLCILQSIASSLFNLHAWQSFSTICKFSLVYLSAWHPPLHAVLHTFLHPMIIFFLQHMPIPSQPVLLSTEIMSSNHSPSLNPLLRTLSCSLLPPFSSLPAEMPSHFPFLQAWSHFYATQYFEHNCCTISLSLSMIHPYW